MRRSWASKSASGGARFATRCSEASVEFKVAQELMRHSSLRSALDVYTQAVGLAKQAAVLSLSFAPPDFHEGCEIIGLA
jgi:hypothetical protein